MSDDEKATMLETEREEEGDEEKASSPVEGAASAQLSSVRRKWRFWFSAGVNTIAAVGLVSFECSTIDLP